MIYIGIDPAFRKNGIAICKIENDKVNFYIAESFIFFLQFIDAIDYKCTIAVENSNLQNVTFDMSGNKNIIARKSRNAGMNQAISQMICDFIKYKGLDLKEISPAQKGKKLTHVLTTLIAKNQKHDLINYKGLDSEQDKRDSYKLALMIKK